jgi:hypothetical protein
MREARNEDTILVGKPEVKEPTGKARNIDEYKIRTYLAETD